MKEKITIELNNRKSYTENEIESEREEASTAFKRSEVGYLCEISRLKGKLQAIKEIIAFVEGL